MNQDLQEIYQQTVKTCTLFAACCEDRANFYLVDIAIQSSYPVVCQFLIEDVDNANNRAYVLQQLLANINGATTIKSDWQEYNKHALREYLTKWAPQIQSKMNDGHIRYMAQMWVFGQNIEYNQQTIAYIAKNLGVTETELPNLNKIFTNSAGDHYHNFFEHVMQSWCKRASVIHNQTQEVFNKITDETSTIAKKVKL